MDAKRTHSPDYPAIGLGEAINRLRALFDEIHSRSVPRELVATGLGYRSLNGASMSAIAAERKYGLLDRVGDMMKISDRGKSILFPNSPRELAEALREAAVEPLLFKDIFAIFGEQPRGDALQNYLLRKGFLPQAAKAAQAAYHDTMALLAATPLPSGSPQEYAATSEFSSDKEPEEAAMQPSLPEPERQFVPPVGGNPAPGPQPHASAAAPVLREGERRIFDYDLEADGGVGIVIRGAVETEEALDIISDWIAIKKKEIARKGPRTAKSWIRVLDGKPAVLSAPPENGQVVVSVDGERRLVSPDEWDELPIYAGLYPPR